MLADFESPQIQLLLRPREAALALAISQSLLWRKTKAGEIPAVRMGAHLRYDSAALAGYVKSAATPYQPQASLRRKRESKSLA